MPRGYRYVKRHPCARCGWPTPMRRKLCDRCWDSIPADIKQRILWAAMSDREITIDLSAIPAPRVKRLPAYDWGDLTGHST